MDLLFYWSAKSYKLVWTLVASSNDTEAAGNVVNDVTRENRPPKICMLKSHTALGASEEVAQHWHLRSNMLVTWVPLISWLPTVEPHKKTTWSSTAKRVHLCSTPKRSSQLLVQKCRKSIETWRLCQHHRRWQTASHTHTYIQYAMYTLTRTLQSMIWNRIALAESGTFAYTHPTATFTHKIYNTFVRAHTGKFT